MVRRVKATNMIVQPDFFRYNQGVIEFLETFDR